ncbi:hypothetical protein FGRA07_11094 [Fusarium graminearum]|nr:hypothetical protein FGRA07_11094 [Fusarium graminearum]
MSGFRVRKDVRRLSDHERDKVVRAFKHIMELPPDDNNSYFTIAGYHGLPEPQYCYHGVVLFPTWHRAYLCRLEDALRTAPGCEDLALPYWDEASNETKEEGIPRIFTDKEYIFQDGSSIPNPLRSYKLPKGIVDVEDKKTSKDTKPEGYQTVRYPYSGLVSDKFADRTRLHNSALDDKETDEVAKILNQNVIRWLYLQKFQNHEEKWISSGEKDNYVNCLEAPNYTVFSNTTSAERYNEENRGKPTVSPVVPIEQPHNAVHLAVGGFNVPGDKNHNVYEFANGDMGENDTAAFDPLFFFHHCFIDYIFWRWQDRHNKKESLEIMKGYPGTQLIKRGKATANFTMDFPLAPFEINDQVTGKKRDMTSNDVVDISKLGYTYTEPGLHLNLMVAAQRIFSCLRDDSKYGKEGIENSRLVSRRFRDIASKFLITEISVCLNSGSFARFESICTHPVFSKGVQRVNILLSYYEAELARDKQLYMMEARSRLLRHWETMERSRLYKRKYNVTDELFRWLGNIAWDGNSDVQQLARGEDIQTTPTPIQSLFLKAYDIYKARFEDQDSLRKDNAHIGRLVNGLASLPGLATLNLDDTHGTKMIMRESTQTRLGDNQMHPEDFSDTGYDRTTLQHFDSAIRQSGWCGSFHTGGNRRHDGTVDLSTSPPLEMLGELCSQLGEKGVRPKSIRIAVKPPPDMRPLAMSSAQQENMKRLVSQASSLIFQFDFFSRPYSLQENPSDEMLALCSITKPFFSAPKLEFLDIYFMEYPRSNTPPTVSLSDILPLDMSWPRLNTLWLLYQPLTMDELRDVVSKNCQAVREFTLKSPWFLQGSVHDALRTIRGFENLQTVDMTFPKGSDFRGTGALDFKWPLDEIKRYLLKETDDFPLPDELDYSR